MDENARAGLPRDLCASAVARIVPIGWASRIKGRMRELLVELLGKILPPATVAAFGGAVRLLNRKEQDNFQHTIAGLITSVFVGVLCFHWLDNSSLSEGQRYVITAIASYSSRDVLAIAEAWLLAILEKAAPPRSGQREDRKEKR